MFLFSTEKKNPIYRIKFQQWNNECHEDYWWKRRVSKLQKKLEKQTIADANKSFFKMGVDESVISYKSMAAEDMEPMRKTPSVNEQNSFRGSVGSNAMNKSSRNIPGLMKIPSKKADLNSSKNYLTSKDVAKDLLNRSGAFSHIKPGGGSRMSRIGTFVTPGMGLRASFMQKSSIGKSISTPQDQSKAKSKLKKTETIRDTPVMIKIDTFVNNQMNSKVAETTKNGRKNSSVN